ncbi:MAG TPA: DUF11 domain-containing protein, partial [Pseudomonadales bacterium]|nr:DUF11 domain-containing protein [Pseudomonadales bacterium]
TGNWAIGTLANGASATLTIVARVDASSSVTNTASVAANEADPNGGNNSDSASVDAVAADLSISKSVDKIQPDLNDVVTYTISVTNQGPDAATGVVVNESLPQGLEFISNSGAGSYDAANGTWTIGNMANGETATLTLTAKVLTTDTITNIVTVSGDQVDPDGSDNTDNAKVGAKAADLSLSKSVSNVNPDLGEAVTFTLSVSNKGPNDATNVIAIDRLPENLEFVSASDASYNPATGEWSVGNLANGASVTLDIVVKVNDAKAITNFASVYSDQVDPNPEDNDDIAVVDGVAADLSVTKSVDDQTPDLNGNVVFTIVVTNDGVDTAENVVMTDALPAGLEFVSSDSANYNATTGKWSVGDMAANTSQTLKITAKVVAVTAINNVAEVTSDTYDPDRSNNKDDGSNDPNGNNQLIDVPEADLKVSKVVDNPSPIYGENVTYTIVVTNDGNDTAENVVMTDELPSGLTFVSASSANYSAADGIWSVGDLASGASATLQIVAQVTSLGELNNIAVVSSDTFDPNEANNIDDGSSDIDENGNPIPNNQRVTPLNIDLAVTGPKAPVSEG